MLHAPPSRYKIVERDRRLVTIDTLTGDEVGIAPVANTGARVDTATLRSSSSNMGGPVRGESAMGATRPGMQSGSPMAIGTPRGTLTTIAGFWPGAQLGADDRITLTTATYYDEHAPRQMRLTTEKANALGVYAIILALTVVIAAAFVIATHFFGVIVLIFIAAQLGKPITKGMMSHFVNDAEEVS